MLFIDCSGFIITTLLNAKCQGTEIIELFPRGFGDSQDLRYDTLATAGSEYVKTF